MEEVHPLVRKEVLGSITFGVVILMSIATLIAYFFNQKIDLSSVALFISPLIALTCTFYGMRSVEGYFQNKINQLTNGQQSDTPTK